MTVQRFIYMEGLRLGEETALKLYLFYPEEQMPVCVYQGKVTNVNPTINYRLVSRRIPEYRSITQRLTGYC